MELRLKPLQRWEIRSQKQPRCETVDYPAGGAATEIGFVYNPHQTLHSVIQEQLRDSDIVESHSAVAYVQSSGALLLYDALLELRERGGSATVVTAVDQGVTTVEGLRVLMAAGVETYVYRASSHAFHAKSWTFSDSAGIRDAVVGSGNLTKGGLVRSVEIAVHLTASSSDDRLKLHDLKGLIEGLKPHARRLATETDLDMAVADFGIPRERQGRRTRVERRPGEGRPSTSALSPSIPPALGTKAITLAAELVADAEAFATPAPTPSVSPRASAGADVDRIIVEANPLRRPHTPGELRLAVPSLRGAADFWGWPDEFTTTADVGRTYSERHVTGLFRSEGDPDAVAQVRIYYYKERSEFRLTSAEFRSRGDQGDIIVIEKPANGAADFAFTAVRSGDATHADLLARATETMPVSGRRWAIE